MANDCECFIEFYGSFTECNKFLNDHMGLDGDGMPAFRFDKTCPNEQRVVGFDVKSSISLHYKDRFIAMVRCHTKWSPPTVWFKYIVASRGSGFMLMNYWEKGSMTCGEFWVDEDTREIKDWHSTDYRGSRGC